MLYPQQHPRRGSVEQFITRCFADRYGAALQQFMPYLVAWHRPRGWGAALGLRPADQEHLFVECYLDEPIEDCIQRLTDKPVRRHHIVEVGNLAITESALSRLLFIAMTVFLAHQGFEWVVFTANPQVRNIFRRLQLKPVMLTSADPLRLGGERLNWGSYYDKPAQVMMGYIPEACALLEQTYLNTAAMSEQLPSWLGRLQQAYQALRPTDE
jgi:hypothetical protein